MKHWTIAVLLLLAACAVPGAPPAPVPAPMAETVPKPPVTVDPVVWQPGYWNWTGSSFVWTPGQYVTATAPHQTWMPGYWEQAGAGWLWRPAHWM